MGEVKLGKHYPDGDNKHEMKVDTRGVMFVFLGAFDGLERITQNRLLAEQRRREAKDQARPKAASGGIGFTAELKPVHGKGEEGAEKNVLPSNVDLTPNQEDLIAYGIMRELAGRIAIRINYKPLSVGNMVRIMKESKTSVYHEYQERFENMGHKLTLDQAALREIARMAMEKKTGARGLSNIFSDLLLSVMYTLSGTAEPTECLLRGSDIRQDHPPVLRRFTNQGADKGKARKEA